VGLLATNRHVRDGGNQVLFLQERTHAKRGKNCLRTVEKAATGEKADPIKKTARDEDVTKKKTYGSGEEEARGKDNLVEGQYRRALKVVMKAGNWRPAVKISTRGPKKAGGGGGGGKSFYVTPTSHQGQGDPEKLRVRKTK